MYHTRMLTRSANRRCRSASGPNLDKVRATAGDLAHLSDAELTAFADDLREDLGQLHPTRDARAHGLALSIESLHRTMGVRLYDVQVKAADRLADGYAVEMQTGEGKTFAAAAAAMLGAFRGHAVHVATPNTYLAQRDFLQLKPAFEVAGVSVGLLPEGGASSEDKRAAYDCDVTYGTGYEFGFDFLRDDLASRSSAHASLGSELVNSLLGIPTSSKGTVTLQRGHEFAVVDEVDNVLIDDAGSPLILSEAGKSPAEDGDAVRLACHVAHNLPPAAFRINAEGAVRLTSIGSEQIHQRNVAIPVAQLRRPWAEYVQQALRAKFLFHRDVQYVIEQDKVRIVDGSTGRIFSDRSWSDGLHQAVEAKEGLHISNEPAVLAQVTRQRYFRQYQTLSGMTGTATGCALEFREVYDLPLQQIPQRLTCRRQLYPIRGFARADQKWAAVVAEVDQHHAAGRPVLVGTRTIADSELVAEQLSIRRLPFQLLNGKQDAEEASIIALAGHRGAITIATNLAGRGTDIRLDEIAQRQGGLHVIVSEPHELTRIDRQLLGRSARQGDPGSARTFVSAEDSFVQTHAPWLARPMVRYADRHAGEVRIDLSSRVASIQDRVAKRQAVARLALLARDIARESLLVPLAIDK